MLLQSVETLVPQLAITVQPRLEFDKWLGPNAVQAALRLTTCLDDARFFQNSEML